MSTDLNWRTVAWIWIAIAGAFYGYDILRDTGAGLVSGGRPLGDDYVNYWSGAYLAWHGRIADIYNWPVYTAFQKTIVGEGLGPYVYAYPPALLVLTAPLAAVSYLPGLAAWLVCGWFCFWRALRLALPGRDALLLSLATPAVFVNAYGGQNGTWTAAFLGGGLCLIDRRPFVAGMAFGMMIYKPQLGLLIPVALLAGRRWWTIAGAITSASVIILASMLLFGLDSWRDYFQFADVMRRTVMEQGAAGWNRLISVFVFARLLGADVPAAYVAQAVVAAAAAAVVAVAWLRDMPAPVRYASLLLGTLLATPYLQDYDLVAGAFLVVWLAQLETRSKQAVLIASASILALPLVASMVTNVTGLALGVWLLIPAFILAARAVFNPHNTLHAAAAR